MWIHFPNLCILTLLKHTLAAKRSPLFHSSTSEIVFFIHMQTHTRVRIHTHSLKKNITFFPPTARKCTLMLNSVLAALLVLPSTSPCVIGCSSAGEFCCTAKTREGPAGSCPWPTTTLANAYVHLEGLAVTHPPCPWISYHTLSSLPQRFLSFPEGLFAHPGWFSSLCPWCGDAKG